ncbi:MAG: chemotaxis protein CheW [Opitutae bacterium]|nr:chemotaxis protein CheW [Opitutae bacterium]
MTPQTTPAQTATPAEGGFTLPLRGLPGTPPLVQVEEVLRLGPQPAGAKVPECIRGVVVVRGKVIPVIDLRQNQPAAAGADEETCVVILQVTTAQGVALNLGLLVDTPPAMRTLLTAEAEAASAPVCPTGTAYLLGSPREGSYVTSLFDLGLAASGRATVG